MPNRYVCTVLEEMRKLDSTKNYSSLLSLIEEVQFHVNRMEASLYDKEEIESYTETNKRLREELSELKKENKELTKEKRKYEKTTESGSTQSI